MPLPAPLTDAFPDETDLLALRAVLRAGDGCTTRSVGSFMARHGRDAPGDAPLALSRLEQAGFLTHRLGDPSPHHAGLRPRLYDLTPRGREAARDAEDGR